MNFWSDFNYYFVPKLSTDNNYESTEDLFNEARKRVIATIQAITFNEYFPIIVFTFFSIIYFPLFSNFCCKNFIEYFRVDIVSTRRSIIRL